MGLIDKLVPIRKSMMLKLDLRFALRILLLTLTVSLALACWYGLHSSWLIRQITQQLERQTQGRLNFSQVQGSIWSGIDIRSMNWHSDDGVLSVHGLKLEGFDFSIVQSVLSLSKLKADEIRWQSLSKASSNTVFPQWPGSYRLDIRSVEVGRLSVDDMLLQEFGGGLEFGPNQLALRALQVQLPAMQFRVGIEAVVQAQQPHQIQGALSLSSADKRQTLQFSVGGTLSELELKGSASGELAGEMSLKLRPREADWLDVAQMRLSGFNPALWHPGLPEASLDLRLMMQHSRAAQLEVINRMPGPWFKSRLPLSRLSVAIDPSQLLDTDRDQPLRNAVRRLALRDLMISLSGGGFLSGHGVLSGERLALDLTAQSVDSAQFSESLQSLELSGSIRAELDARRQSWQIALSQSRSARPWFAIDASVKTSSNQIVAHQVMLRTSAGQLHLRGNMQLDAKPVQSYGIDTVALQGRFERFDLSAILRLPERLQLTGEAELAGGLSKRDGLRVDVALTASQFRDQPLSGATTVYVYRDRLRLAASSLLIGDNRLDVEGDFSWDGDPSQLWVNRRSGKLAVSASLAKLEQLRWGEHLPSVKGALQSKAILVLDQSKWSSSGSLQANQLRLSPLLNVASARFDWSGALDHESPLHAVLVAKDLHLPQWGHQLQSLNVRVDGALESHSLQSSIRLEQAGAEAELVLSARGAMRETQWIGQVDKLRLHHQGLGWLAQGIELERPVDVKLSPQSWSIGEIEWMLGNRQARGRLSLQHQDAMLQALLLVDSRQVGNVDLSMRVPQAKPWLLDPSASLEGKVTASTSSIKAWIDLIRGESDSSTKPDWEIDGAMGLNLALKGQLNRPSLQGRVLSKNLSFKQPANGLAMYGGELDLRFDQQQVFINRLRFSDSGLFELHGGASWDQAFSLKSLDFSWQLQQWPWQSEETMRAMVSGKGKLRMEGSNILNMTGAINIEEGFWRWDEQALPRLSEDVIRIRDRKRNIQSVSSGLTWRSLIDLNFGNKFKVEASGLKGRMAGSLRVDASAESIPIAQGELRLVDASFQAYGQRLKLERSRIYFQGLLSRPQLELLAIRDDLPLRVGVRVHGSLPQPQLRLIAEPDLPDLEKLSWLVLGHGSGQAGPGDAVRLLEALGDGLGLKQTGLREGIKERFGLDELRLTQQGGSVGSGIASSGLVNRSRILESSSSNLGSGDSLLRVGKQLSEASLLTYEQMLGRTEGALRLSYRLSERILLIARIGLEQGISIFIYNVPINLHGVIMTPKGS
jgi:translocation and assembly module TamB